MSSFPPSTVVVISPFYLEIMIVEQTLTVKVWKQVPESDTVMINSIFFYFEMFYGAFSIRNDLTL